MKILLIIPSMLHSTKTIPHKETYRINKETIHTLNASIPAFKSISNEVKKETDEINKTLYITMNDVKDIPKGIYITGRISENYLNVNFTSIENLDQLNNFNKEIASSLELENPKLKFINIVIALINKIFQSIPEKDVEISNKSFNFLINLFKKNNQNEIKISVTHEFHCIQITFNCYLTEDSNNIAKTSKPNEAGEEEAPLLDKKTQ